MPIDAEKLLADLKAHTVTRIEVDIKDAHFTAEQVGAAFDAARKAIESQMSARAVVGLLLSAAKSIGAIA